MLVIKTNNFIIKEQKLQGVFTIEPKKKIDDRGFFQRLFCSNEFKNTPINNSVVNINNSFSKKKGTTRGIHYQISPFQETKIIRCLRGSLVNIIIDIRKSSKNYLKHIKINLTSEKNVMTYVPKGFGNSIQTTSNNTEIIYFTSQKYMPNQERGLNILDPKLNIKLPLKPTIISKKDKMISYI